MFTLAILFDHFKFTLIHGPNIPRCLCNIVLYSIGLPSPVTTGCCFHFGSLRLFILSGVTSLLFSSSILGTYRPGKFIFQCPIFLHFHTVHGVLKARILNWFASRFSSGPHFVRRNVKYSPVSREMLEKVFCFFFEMQTLL